MRILHTADWHLADRLKHVDRTADIRRGVACVAGYCDQERVDVLVVAGDLFSELAKPDSIQASIAHLAVVFRSFLLHGGTIVALAGNHDNDVYCQLLRRAFQLAAPNEAKAGDLLPPGRLYLSTTPVHFRLADRSGFPVQFACMPYPTTHRYPLGSTQHTFINFEQRNQLLQHAWIAQLQRIRSQLRVDHPSVLAAHVNVLESTPASPVWPSRGEDIRINNPVVMTEWTYGAFGHLHRPQMVAERPNMRYAGSIERFDLGERRQNKSVVLVDIGSGQTAPKIRTLPLPATPFYDVRIEDPVHDLAHAKSQYPHAANALVRCHVSYRPGSDNLFEILGEVSRIFPRCYERTWSVAGGHGSNRSSRESALNGPAVIGGSSIQSFDSPQAGATHGPIRDPGDQDPGNQDLGSTAGSLEVANALYLDEAGRGIAQVVLDYLGDQLKGDPDRESLLALATQLMENQV